MAKQSPREFYRRIALHPTEVQAVLTAIAVIRSQDVPQEVLMQHGFNESVYHDMCEGEHKLRQLLPAPARRRK